MFDIQLDWQPKLEELRSLLKSKKHFDRALPLALELNAFPHTSVVSRSTSPTFGDRFLEGLKEEDFSVMPRQTDETIAWHLWHITRIEDLVANLFLAEQDQVFDDGWMKRMNTSIRDTGNVMTDEEILAFSQAVNKKELIAYRNAVGLRTQEVLRRLSPEDLKRKPSPESLERLLPEGCLLEDKGSFWLKDFWGAKTFAGLILLPLTRHQMMHLTDSLTIKTILHSR